MTIGDIHTLADVAKITGESRNLITFLVHDRQIPYRVIATSLVIDGAGLDLLKAAIADYRRKAGPLDSSPGRSKAAARRRSAKESAVA